MVFISGDDTGGTQGDLLLLTIFTFCMICSVPVLFKFPAPYGKFHDVFDKIPLVSMKVNWKIGYLLGESPSIWMPLLVTLIYANSVTFPYLLFLILYEVHYIHRVTIYPFYRVRSRTPSTILIPIFSFMFQVVNATCLSKFVLFACSENIDYLSWLKLAIGVAIFLTGMYLNMIADQTLISLRRSEEDTSYYPPPMNESAIFRFFVCGNYSMEILEWIGMYVAFSNLATLSFIVTSCCNLIPRAYANHLFCRKSFKEKYQEPYFIIIPYVF